jgi:hypothetical protein
MRAGKIKKTEEMALKMQILFKNLIINESYESK